jgi:hypothetical protein
MFQHPDLMLPMANDHHRRLLAAANRYRLRTAVLGGRRRRADHGHSTRAPAARPSPVLLATAAAVSDTTAGQH